MLKYKIYDHKYNRWCSDAVPGTHCYSDYLLTPTGEVQEYINNYYLGETNESSRFTVCPWIGIIDDFKDEIYAGDLILVIPIEKERVVQVKYDYNKLAWGFSDGHHYFSWQEIKHGKLIKRIGNYLDAKD